MAKKQKKEETLALPSSWIVQGREYKIGEIIRVMTPELGSIDVKVRPNSYYFGFGSVSLNLGWIKTPLPCTATTDGFNAILQYSVIGDRDGQLHIVYFCHCRHGVHSTELRWWTNLVDGVISCEGIGFNYYATHNHPLVEGYEYLRPGPQPILVPAPIDVKPGTQFSIFD